MPATSTVCMIAKNEGPYLLEWIAYYLTLGFDEIVVYENNSEDNSARILKKLSDSGFITYRPWDKGRHESPQITAYHDAVRKTRNEWIFFIDADEFLVLHQHKDVREFLNRFENRPEVTSVSVNWRVFGDSNLKKPDDRLVTERFTLASRKDFPPNAHLKTFARVSALGSMINMHICETNGLRVNAAGEPLQMSNWGLSDVIELDVAQVNHYYTKTYPEYLKKKQRGNAAVPEGDSLKYTWYHDEAFLGHNRNDEEDTSISNRRVVFQEQLHRLRSLFAPV